jgi:hypothetical protein
MLYFPTIVKSSSVNIKLKLAAESDENSWIQFRANNLWLAA